MSSHVDRMTNDMRDCMISDEDLKAEYDFCKKKHYECMKAAKDGFPGMGSNGEPVVHGCRMMVWQVADYWQMRMKMAQSLTWTRFEEN